MKKRSFYQDRLGTNIGKALKRRMAAARRQRSRRCWAERPYLRDRRGGSQPRVDSADGDGGDGAGGREDGSAGGDWAGGADTVAVSDIWDD